MIYPIFIPEGAAIIILIYVLLFIIQLITVIIKRALFHHSYLIFIK